MAYPGIKTNSLRTELYLKRGGKIVLLTNFNRIGGRKKRYLVSDCDWNAKGSKIIFQVVPFNGKHAASPELWVIIFSEPQ